MVWFLMLFLAACGPVAAQRKPAVKTPVPGASRWPIESLSVEGNRIYSQEQIISAAGLKTGELAGKQEFEAARDRLVATGAFETVGYRFSPAPNSKGFQASFQVTEVQPVYPVRFQELPEAELRTFLKQKDPLFGPRMAATKAVIDRYTKWIEEFLASRRQEDKVSGRVAATGPDQFEILFRPSRPLPAVAQVTFEGNQAVPTGKLQDTIGGVAIGAGYTVERFRQLLDSSVKPLYEARGLLQVSFPKITTEPAKDVRGLIVHVTVAEGQPFKLDKVEVAGTTVLSSKEIQKIAKFQTGEIANFDEINQGLDRVRKTLRRQGYMNADTSVDRKLNDQSKTVDLLVHVKEGPQFVFGKLGIEGLDLHGEAAIKKMWGLKEGKPFNVEYPNHFLDRVKEEQLFENLGKTIANTDVHEDTRTVDVTLVFGSAPKAEKKAIRDPVE
jgi:outer membrane protein insertion porin family